MTQNCLSIRLKSRSVSTHRGPKMKVANLLLVVLFEVLVSVSGLALNNDAQVAVDQLSIQEMMFLEGDPLITHKVIFEVSERYVDESVMEEKTKKIGTLTFGLFGNQVPVTVANFVHLANMTYGYGYKDVIFHRIIKDFMIQGGDFEHGTGTGGYSVYNKQSFKDENFIFKHNKIGRLSMANGGPDDNGSQFFVTTVEECPWLNGLHVVFGQTIEGFDTLTKLNEVPVDRNDKPLMDHYVSNIAILNILKTSDPLGLDKNLIESFVQPEVLQDSSPNYRFFILCITFAGIAFFVRNWYYKREYLKEISMSDYF